MMSGEESVSAMKPRVAVVVSGASAALTLAAGTALGLLLSLVLLPDFTFELQPLTNSVPAAVAPAVMMNLRLEKLVIALFQKNQVNGW
jgi:hypothetical protein